MTSIWDGILFGGLHCTCRVFSMTGLCPTNAGAFSKSCETQWWPPCRTHITRCPTDGENGSHLQWRTTCNHKASCQLSVVSFSLNYKPILGEPAALLIHPPSLLPQSSGFRQPAMTGSIYMLPRGAENDVGCKYHPRLGERDRKFHFFPLEFFCVRKTLLVSWLIEKGLATAHPLVEMKD